jgi:hypothetical protein
MVFEAGNKFGGRRKGAKNKLTNDVRQIFHEIYNDMGKQDEILDSVTGKMRKKTGKEAMMDWARDNQTEFYRLYGKMIPTTQEIQTDNHEDFLDELIVEADAVIAEPEQLVIEATPAQPLAIKEVKQEDVTPDTPETDAHLV